MPAKRPAPGSASRGTAFKTSSHKRARTDGAEASSSRGRGRGRGGASRGGGSSFSRGGASSGGGGVEGVGGRGSFKSSSEPKVYKIDWRSKPKPAPTSDEEDPGPSSRNGKGPKTKAPPAAPPAPTPLPPRTPASSFRVMCGSYERHLYGLHVTPASRAKEEETNLKVELKPMFIFPAHPSAIASVAAAGQGAKWGASGAGEDVVKVWDLRRKVEVGILQGHTGVITSLSFPTRTYLLSASSSGELNIYRTRDWALLRTLRGHTGAIRAVAAHPGARLALSIGEDAHLRAWDLMRAKAAGAVRLALNKTEVPEDVRWSHDGETFGVLARGAMLLFDSAMRPLAELRTPRESPRTRGTCIAFAPQARGTKCGLLLIGTEDAKVKVYRLPDAHERRSLIEAKEEDEVEVEAAEKGLTLIGTLVGHRNRVKSLSTQSFSLPSGGDTELAISISSDGFVRVFNLTPFYDALGSKNPAQVEVSACGAYDTKGARLTCLTTVSGDGALDKSKGAAQDDEEESGDEELLGSDNSQDEDEEEKVGSDDEIELDEQEEEELELLKERIRQARAAGVVVEGMSEVESDEDDSEVEDEEAEAEEA